ncbi:vitamin K epoxide reductase/DsbA family protein [Nannocystis radixulma]|uniref:Vitamin K epoxide reductase family protein n=1 Tax=Nannocystis radixulma TaxID=2995305 RepID=A0ABT5B2H9_9BACT|nr:vitamin K epoxide reductase family protein [Nannocystis radixulma]MDC0667885.1 vitamin K epoxide reductase family protein [Nannocystis radixulma]
MRTRIFGVGLLLAALAGFVFASASTLDFVQHLDRQVHELHCSFAPGLIAPDKESTGCQVTLLSPYSSIMRTSLWGGIPISLPAMAVFAFLAFRAIELLAAEASRRRTAAAIALATTAVPVLASVIMGYLAFTQLHAACKLCIGIYFSSGAALVMAVGALRAARAEAAAPVGTVSAQPGQAPAASAPPVEPDNAKMWLAAAGQAFAFVTVPVVVYALLVPDYSRYIGTCGALARPDDPYAVMVPLGPTGDGAPAIEVFDPLCPSCRAFEERLRASGQDRLLRRQGVMFPLDSECNWMVPASLHPGACRVSKAVLCAATVPGVGPDAVVQWAFEQQEELLAAGKQDLDGVSRMIAARFPELGACIKSAETEAKLNKSLRWTVKNQLPVMTPQLYVAGVKLCDEDSDLGMDFTLHHMLQKHAAGQLASTAPAAAPREPGVVPGSEAASRPADKATKAAPKREPAKAAPEADKSASRPAEPAEPRPAEPAAEPEKKAAPPATELPSVRDPETPASGQEEAP